MTTGVATPSIDAQRREARLSRVKILRRALPFRRSPDDWSLPKAKVRPDDE